MEMFSKSKDIFFSNFDKICRTCIKTITEPLHQIFDSEVAILNESIKTYELLMAVSTLKIHPDDDLPKAICIQCLDSLTKAYNFQKMCILSDLCMKSAILPNQLQINLQKLPITSVHNNKQSENPTIFEPCVENLITASENPNSISILYSEPMNKGIENIAHSDQSIVSKPMQSEMLTSEDINAMKIVFLPPASDLIQHSGSRIIIPSEINSRMDIFAHVTPSISHVDHIGQPSMVIPNQINSNGNIFQTEPSPKGDDEAIIFEPRIKSSTLLNEPQVDFTNVSLSEVPPWKREIKFHSIKTVIQEPCVQNIIIRSENQRNINLSDTNVSDPCKHSTKIPNEEKNCKEILSIETLLPTVSHIQPVQCFNEADIPKENEPSSIAQSVPKRTSNVLLANTLASEIEIVDVEETTLSKTESTAEYIDDDEKSNLSTKWLVGLRSTKCGTNNFHQADVIQTKKTSNHDNHDDKARINLLADSHSTEGKGEHCNLANVKNVGPISVEEDDYHSDDENTKIFLHEEDLIHISDMSNTDTKKKVTTSESDESNNESLDQKEDVDIKIENSEPFIQEIEKPNPRTKKNAYFTCETCGKTFDREHRLHRHMNLHKKEGRPFECEYCRRRFAQEAHLQRHFITHEKTFLDMIEAKQNVDGYQCPECPRKFLKQESLASHMRTHRKEIDATKRFTCEICSKVFESLYRLTRHKQLHEGNRKYNCEICGKTFGLSSHLVDHLNMHSGIKPHVCDYCQKSFQQACTLKDHLRTHTGEQPFLCAECGKKFNNSSNLRQHQLRHSGIKRYQCPECPSKFTCKSGLFSHLTTHRNQKPYVCGTCGSRFTKSYSLKKHERIHTGEKPYKCDYCEMRFNSSDHMKRHMRTHTGEKPYKCKYCEKKFAQSNDMIKHLRSHVGENVYKCEECDASFRLNTELKKHISEHYQAQVQNKSTKKNSKNH